MNLMMFITHPMHPAQPPMREQVVTVYCRLGAVIDNR